MNNDILKILAQSNKDIDNQKLMDYLSNKMGDIDRNEMESTASASDLYLDAIEGLEKLNNSRKIEEITNEINQSLKKKLVAKRKRKEKKPISDSLMYYSIIIILLLAVITFIIIRKQLGH